MFVPTRSTKLFLYQQSVDMRYSYDHLANICLSQCDMDPYSGHIYIFMNRRRNRLKALVYDGTGSFILMKRLDVRVFTTSFNEAALKNILASGFFCSLDDN